MGKINLARVALGGLLAGVVLFVGDSVTLLLIAGQFEAAFKAHNLSLIGGAPGMALNIAYTYLLGLSSVWLYAAIRPRFGIGPKTAICAGLALWFFVNLISYLQGTMVGFLPQKLQLHLTAWSLFIKPIAALAGAWLYKENAQPL